MFRLSVVGTVVAVAAAIVLGTTSVWAITPVVYEDAKLTASDATTNYLSLPKTSSTRFRRFPWGAQR